MQIQRRFYLQQLIDGKQNGLIKIVTGIRRCGKSYLLFKLFRQHLLESGVAESHIIQIALDDIESQDLREPLSLYRHVKGKMTDSNQYYILLDEVQLVPALKRFLTAFCALIMQMYMSQAVIQNSCQAILLPNFEVVAMKSAFILFPCRNTVRAQGNHPLRHGMTIILTVVCHTCYRSKRKRRNSTI